MKLEGRGTILPSNLLLDIKKKKNNLKVIIQND